MIKSMVFDFYSIGGWCHSGWWEWDLGTFTLFQLLNFGFPLVGLRLSGFPIGGYIFGFSIRGTPACWFLILTLWNLSSESVGVWNFEILVEDFDTGGPSSIAVRIESFFTIFFFPIPICTLCLKNDEGKAEGIIKWEGWGGSSLHGKKWRKIYEPFKISSLSW